MPAATGRAPEAKKAAKKGRYAEGYEMLKEAAPALFVSGASPELVE